jgi:anaerobic sulfite reductase subunit B
VSADRAGPEPESPLLPAVYLVADRRTETEDVVTLRLAPQGAGPLHYRAGQFNMLTAFGVGEVPISISGHSGADGTLEHTVRDVGAVTRALCGCRVGDVVGVRGPFGTDWGVEHIDPARDVVVVAGGIGLAPLRAAIGQLIRRGQGGGGQVFVLVGARRADQVIFSGDLDAWRRDGAQVAVTVDVASPAWHGHVGLVTSLLPQAGFDPLGATALLCGPEIMMRFTARALLDTGFPPDAIRVSLERNMQCGLGWCGHCQLGPFLLCRDGPVVPYDRVAGVLMERER